MKVLVLDCGEHTLRYHLVDIDDEKTLSADKLTDIGRGGAPDHRAAVQQVLETIDASSVGAVAHRVGHGGERFRAPVTVNAAVKDEIRRLIPLLPQHHPFMLAGIEAAEDLITGVPHIAVFDTTFHRTIPDEAAVYGLPYEMFQKKGIRKFGFHGDSHRYTAEAAADFLETPLRRLNVVTCHLGNGASLCAVQRGRSIDTSMGFSPLPGLIMGTRVGDLDPGIIPYLMKSEGLTVEQVDRMLNHEGGLLGLSGVSNDMLEILAAAEAGDGRALLAVKAYCYRVRLYIGAYIAAMGGIDVLAFTGGVGQNSRGIRARCVQGLEKLGIAIDLSRNKRAQVDEENPVIDLSARHSFVSVLVVDGRDELMIARRCARALDYQGAVQQDVLSTDRRPIRVSVSAHHVHLCRADIDALFGPGHKLTKKAPLYIESEFACEEAVNLVGPRGRVDRVRVLGPERSKTQVEISRTEEFKLGIDAPIRASGDLDGSPGIILEGPAGQVEIPEGLICAMRHIHMTPKDAENYGVRDKDKVMVKMEGPRELIFGDVLVRVWESYKLEMHIDTDEGNAAELPPVSEGYLVMIQHRGSRREEQRRSA